MSIRTSTNVTVHMNIDQLVNNEGDKLGRMDNAWMTVPKQWIEIQVKNQGFSSLAEFYTTYLYDDTDGWLQRAIDDGVLVGCGCGVMEASSVHPSI